MRMCTTNGVSKRRQFIINEAAKVTLDYTFADRSDICSTFYMEWLGS